jgi:hypothetical protein
MNPQKIMELQPKTIYFLWKLLFGVTSVDIFKAREFSSDARRKEDDFKVIRNLNKKVWKEGIPILEIFF